MQPPVGGAPLPQEPARWPTPIGVLGIIFASLGLIGGVCGLAWPAILPWYVDQMKNSWNVPQSQIDLMLASQPPTVWYLLSASIGLVFSILLMIGSIRLLRRRASGAKLVKAWAWITIVWVPLNIVISMMLAPGLPAGSQPDPTMQQQQQVGMYFTIGCMAILGLAWPVFCVIWFARPKIRQQVSTWTEISPEVI
jgi:hypothetical protein